MGKGIIQSHIGSGKYTVEVQYDRSGVDEQIAKLESVIEKLDEKIDDPDIPEQKKRYLKAARASAQKRIDFLEGFRVPKNDTIEAWCADLTTDLSGEIGLIEIARDRSQGVNIQPGYEDGADYDSARDGALIPTMGMPPAMAYVNLGLLPGAQKWLPTYRYAKIDSIDRSKDKCDVTFLTKQSGQQDLTINETSQLKGVPIEYMFCDSAAFSEGDEVIVKFEEYDFDKPKVIGFKDNPQPCEIIAVLIVSSPSGGEAFAWDINTDSLLVGVDTYENVTSKLNDMGFSVSPTEAQTSDNMCNAGWGEDAPIETKCPWSHSEGWDRTMHYDDDEYKVYHPNTAMPQFIVYGRAFGADETERTRWSDDDYVKFKTTEGSSEIEVLEVVGHHGSDDDPDATFNKDYVYVQAESVVTETWTMHALYYSEGPRFYIEGESLGYLDDFLHNDGFNNHSGFYPYTQYEHYGEYQEPQSHIWSILEKEGMDYEVRNGNCVIGEDGSIVAPYIYNWDGGALWKNPIARQEFEDLTGVDWPQHNDEGHPNFEQYRTMLFYAPVFAAHDAVPPSFAYFNACGADGGFFQIFDLWADCNWYTGPEGTQTLDGVDADFFLSVGLAEKKDSSVIYDAYSLRNGYTEQHDTGIHVYCSLSAESALSGPELETFDLVNQERTSRDLPALAYNHNLQAAAERHLADMLEHYEEYAELIGTDAAHYGTDDSDWRDRATDAGYFLHACVEQGPYSNSAGENIAYTSSEEYDAEAIVDGWMDSPEHRENILHSDVIDTGLAHGVAEDGSHFVCQTFAYRLAKWPGYGPLKPDGIEQYMINHFNWPGDEDETRLPKVYLA